MTMIDPARPENLIQSQNPEHQVIQLVNTGDTLWRGQYASTWYEAKPGERIFIPFFAMCHWFGHPDAADVPGDRQRQYRLDEFRRLQVHYGVYDDGMEAFKAAVPDVQLFTATGEKIITVCDDPVGDHLRPAMNDKKQIELMQTAMEEMQKQVVALQSMIQLQQRADDSTVKAGDDVGSDTPRPIPVPKAPTSEVSPDVPIPPGVPTAPHSIPVPDTGIVTKDGPGMVPKQG